MDPLMGFTLAHPEQPPLHYLEGVRLQVDEDKEQPILGRGQWTVRIGCIPPGGTRSSIEAPFGHVRLERGFKRSNQRPKLLSRETGQVEHLGGAGLDVGKP
jgi:hypothetical protein